MRDAYSSLATSLMAAAENGLQEAQEKILYKREKAEKQL